MYFVSIITKTTTMLDQLKELAGQKLSELMQSNSLNAESTGEAAQEGAGALIDSIKEKLAGGGLDQITDLFSGGAENTAGAGLFDNIQSKIAEVLQNKGMDAEEAKSEAASTAAGLVDGIKEKFQSSDAADSAFDLSNITNLIGGDAKGLFGKVTSFFGKK